MPFVNYFLTIFCAFTSGTLYFTYLHVFRDCIFRVGLSFPFLYVTHTCYTHAYTHFRFLSLIESKFHKLKRTSSTICLINQTSPSKRNNNLFLAIDLSNYPLTSSPKLSSCRPLFPLFSSTCIIDNIVHQKSKKRRILVLLKSLKYYFAYYLWHLKNVDFNEYKYLLKHSRIHTTYIPSLDIEYP